MRHITSNLKLLCTPIQMRNQSMMVSVGHEMATDVANMVFVSLYIGC